MTIYDMGMCTYYPTAMKHLMCSKYFVAEPETQLEWRVKTLQISQGCKYPSDMFKEFCKGKAIWRQPTISRTPQKNGIVECRNRALLNMFRSMIAHADLPISFWGNALLKAAYILDHLPSNNVFASRYELWYAKKSSLDHLRPQGLDGYVHNPTHKHRKFCSKATKMVLIRYPEHSKVYVMYREYLNGGMAKMGSCTVDFLKNDFPSMVK